jgi:signal transduction histidine kinase
MTLHPVLKNLWEVLCALPTSESFPDDEWEQRHRAVLSGYAVAGLVVILVALGNGYVMTISPIHLVVELSVAVAPVVMLRWARGRLAKQLVASAGILGACGLLVHVTSGLIESHFAFFVILPLVALYTDWRPFAFAVAYVALGHGVVGAIDPEGMYNHQAAIDAPFVWGAIHAAYVVGLCVVMLIHWYFTDRRRMQLVETLQQLRTAQAQLVEAQKLESIGQLAAGVAHEINTPVQYVSDNTTFLTESFTDVLGAVDQLSEIVRGHDGAALDRVLDDADIDFLRDEIPGALAQSKEGLERVTEIVKAMKDFSHPGVEVADNDLNRIIESTSAVSRNEWKYAAELDLDLDPAMPLVPCSEGQVKQVILNMIVNASHAVLDRHSDGDQADIQGRLAISTRAEDGSAVIRISDNGSGMPPEVREHIFEQFFTTKEVGKGTGQGLALAWDVVVNGHGGTIAVESEVGVGSTFVISLPLTSAVASV